MGPHLSADNAVNLSIPRTAGLALGRARDIARKLVSPVHAKP